MDSDEPSGREGLRHLFNQVPDVYERVRPTYPDELLVDLASISALSSRSEVLEVGCGTGQATRSLAALGCAVTAVELGEAMAEVARHRLAQFANVTVETASFETWNDRGRDFDLLVAASSWHWIDPSVGWMRAHRLLRPDGWMAVMGHVVIRVPGMLEGYAETADLHERFAPGNPGWSHPPLEEEVRTTSEGWGPPNVAPEGPFGPTIVRWYPTVQWFDGEGYADLLRSTSLYRELHQEVREPLLDAIADRVRTSLGDRVARSYLCVLRVGPRLGGQSG